MKKLLVLVVLGSILVLPALATGKYSEQLVRIEEELYGINYSDQTDEKRISRLEQSVYGSISTQANNAERVKRLYTDLLADVFDEKITPSEDTFAQEEELAEDNTVRYPALDRVETKLFQRPNDKAGLNARIVKIEQHLFNKTYDKDDYHTRVERIKNNVFRDDYSLASNSANEDNYYLNGSGGDFNSDQLSGLNRNLYNMNKTTFADRLASLENQVLGGAYEFDTDEERLNRLDSAYKAQKSIRKYDSNKFQQGLSTAMQVGAMLLMMLCMVL